jgi:hypothetical protein
MMRRSDTRAAAIHGHQMGLFSRCDEYEGAGWFDAREMMRARLGQQNLPISRPSLERKSYAVDWQTTSRIISAVTRGLNASIAEGLAIEGEQFARMVPTHDLREAVDAWIAHQTTSYQGR